jgi:hypothetical protein
MDGSELSQDNEALARVRSALDRAKKKLDSGALPHGEESTGEAPPVEPALLQLQKLEKINRFLRTAIILLLCGAAVAAMSLTVYHVAHMRAMRRRVGEMSARVAAAGEERERVLRRHAAEVARLNREVRDLRKVDRREKPRKRFLGIF